MSYTPDATLVTQPADTGVLAATAAAEFRTIKTYMRDVLLAAINLKAPALNAVLVTPNLGTPSAGVLTSCTGLPISTGVAGLGANVATFLGTPTTANLLAAVTGETGTGAVVFGTSPTIATPVLTNPTITDYTETVYAPAAGTAFTVNLANGTEQRFTSNGNITITLPAAAAGKSYTIQIAYGGAHTLTWAGGTAIKWAGGSAPTATSINGKFDTFVFTCYDASNTFGNTGGANA